MGTDLVKANREAHTLRDAYSLTPRERRCNAYAAGGTPIAAQVNPS